MSQTNSKYLHLIDQFTNKNVLVIGDFMLDVYLKGTSKRLSPEAPVPVVDISEKTSAAGGAANTAFNLAALGANVTFLTVIGTDPESDHAMELMEKADINKACIIRHPGRHTITKTRVMSGSHVITRYDYGTTAPIDTQAETVMIEYLQEYYKSFDAIVISDYNKGVVTENILRVLIELRAQDETFIAVDSKRLSFFRELHPVLVKPNYEEAVELIGVPDVDGDRIAYVQSHAGELQQNTGASVVAVTLDEEGSVILREKNIVHRSLTQSMTTPNVRGAGDTYISAMTLAAVSRANVGEMAEIATAAATIALRKECTAFCNVDELKSYFNNKDKCISSLAELEHICAYYKLQGKRIVFTNGCFDILHSGHVSYLNRAKTLGDVLIVGMNNDESIRRLKGPKRPINPMHDRMLVLSGLSAVDHIISFGNEQDDTPISLIRVAKPHIFVKGGDYTREKLPEADTVEEVGGKIVFLSLVADHSTTRIIEQINKTSVPALV